PYCFLVPTTSTVLSRPRIMMISSGTFTGAGGGGGGGGGANTGFGAGLAAARTTGARLRNPVYSSLGSLPLPRSIFLALAVGQNRAAPRFVARQSKELGVFRRDQDDDHSRIERRAAAIGLHLLGGGKDGDVLQHRGRDVRGGAVRWTARHQRVDAHSGQDES